MSFERAVREHEEGQGPNKGGKGQASLARGNIQPTYSSNGATPLIVTLAFLSEHIPATLLTEELAGLLAAETGESAVLVRFKGPGLNGAKSNGTPEFDGHDSASALDRSLTRQEGFQSLTVGMNNGASTPDSIHSLLSKLNRRFRFVLVELLCNERPAPWARR